MSESIWENEWSPELECGGVAVVPGTPIWCETHMMPFGHRRDGVPVNCSCGGWWATRAHRPQHNHKHYRWEGPMIHTPTQPTPPAIAPHDQPSTGSEPS